jgi:hypothetical protein
VAMTKQEQGTSSNFSIEQGLSVVG